MGCIAYSLPLEGVYGFFNRIFTFFSGNRPCAFLQEAGLEPVFESMEDRRQYTDVEGQSADHQALFAWAQWIKERLAEGCDVYVYYNNDDEGHAVQNAASLKRYVSGN
jgi:hypothetical protein